MKYLRDRKGIVLVTTLMLTLISLAVVLALLYMVTRGTQNSGMQKKYRTALEASYGGTEVLTKAIIPFMLKNFALKNYSTGTASMAADLTAGFSNVGLQVGLGNVCLRSKIKSPTSSWGAQCDAAAPASRNPDMTMKLPSASGDPFLVFTKIIDTQPGNSDMGALHLEGAGVAEGSNVIEPQHKPYIYKIEVQGQREGDRTVSSDLEVLYAY